MYLSQDTQCIVLNNADFKNIRLLRGTVIKVESHDIGNIIVTTEITVQNNLKLSVVIQRESLQMEKPVSESLEVSKEDSKLLR